MFSQRSVPDGKENKMKVVIRYETERVTFNLSDEEARQMGCCVNIDLESIPEDERQSKLQEACDEHFNRPDYNNWHKYWRHQGESKANLKKTGFSAGSIEVLMRIFPIREMRTTSSAQRPLCQMVSYVL